MFKELLDDKEELLEELLIGLLDELLDELLIGLLDELLDELLIGLLDELLDELLIGLLDELLDDIYMILGNLYKTASKFIDYPSLITGSLFKLIF
jgi:hypothetical protein